MKRSGQWMPMLVALVLAACGGAEREGTDTAQGAGDVATLPATAPRESLPDTNVTGAGTGTATAPTGETIKLNAVGNSGVNGEVTVQGMDGHSRVVVRVTGAKAAGAMQGHVHEGTCEKLGKPVAPLEAITVNETGMGSSTSMVNLGPADLTDGEHVVAFHQPGGKPGAAVVCGVLRRP